jgi:hypothetical protein
MSVLQPINPVYGTGFIVAPGAATASHILPKGQKQVCLTSLNTVQCYVRVGDAGVVATTSDYPVPIGSQVIVTKAQDQEYIAYLAPAGAGSLHVITGEGW